ncbi:hypothetical protein IWQ60_010158 [Tieghemiomyces parasiticus]|uniref:RGS domain-containing protein n=1 Tax=Tieghemiomyces parasiticus TaxID=78921 RepID=A0A9W7ZMB0_9FUNG|nr:hypothetical protein IWQ60_010158 [Tieghemiomyces parasiticus]
MTKTEAAPELTGRNYFSSREILQRSATGDSNRSRGPLNPQAIVDAFTPETWHNVKDHNLRSGLPTLEQVLNRKSRSPIALQDFYHYLQRAPEGRRLIAFWKAVSYHEELLKGGEALGRPGHRQSSASQYLSHSQFIYPPSRQDHPSTRAMSPAELELRIASPDQAGPSGDVSRRNTAGRPGRSRSFHFDEAFRRHYLDMPLTPNDAQDPDRLVIERTGSSPHPHETSHGTPCTDPERYARSMFPPPSPGVHFAAPDGATSPLPPPPYPPMSPISPRRGVSWVEPTSVEHSALHIIRKYIETEPLSAAHLPELLDKDSQRPATYAELTRLGVMFPAGLRMELFRTVEREGLQTPHLFDQTKAYAYAVLNHRYYTLFLTEATTQNLTRAHTYLRLAVSALMLTAGLSLALFYILTQHVPRTDRLVSLPLVFFGWWGILVGFTRCAPDLAVLNL